MSSEAEAEARKRSREESSPEKKKTIEGKVVLTKKKTNALDFNDILDRVHDQLFHSKVSLQLIFTVPIHAADSSSSSSSSSSSTSEKGLKGKPAYLKNWKAIAPPTPTDSVYAVTFDWDNSIGVPGAFLIRNLHRAEFYLKTLTLEDVPGHGRINFICNSWVYRADKYKTDRVFFSNQAYLPHETPAPLLPYRKEELLILRGNGTGKLEEWDRVYDYAFYNDLGDPDKNPNYSRPVLGGSSEFPYPRRSRTGRPLTKTDPKTESRLPLIKSLSIYVPSDERFSHLKLSDFLGSGLKSIGQFLLQDFESLFDCTPNEFDSFQDVLQLFEGGLKIPNLPSVKNFKENFPCEFLKELFPRDGEGLAKYPVPEVIKVDKSAWGTDKEFARELLAGVNPVCICLLQEFPPTSRLDHKLFGNQSSSINRNHIENSLDGIQIDEAIKAKRLFILDHHDTLMPYLRRINATSSKIYASRTLLFLQKDGTLKPIAIELSLPHPEGDNFGAISKVYIPSEEGVESSVWQLAKAFVAVNDSGVHQLISHWLNTHAVVEPFVIATNRQLSVLHPIHKLLKPHLRDTININAFGRQILINGGGLLEKTVFPERYALELSSKVYKHWVFPEQALPTDLIKRGMAVEDPNSSHGLRLLIQDYPYAVDGLEIWSAIKTWVSDYCNFYYKTDDMIRNDTELQSWWKELREEGHGDKKDEPWWPKLQTRVDLIDTLTILIWLASALHAAVNFGQYPYAGYFPNRPTISRRFMPEPNTPEYDELKDNPEKVFLKTITAQLQALLGVALIELLSRHSSDEKYLGQRDTSEWTNDTEPLEAFEKFGKKLKEIEGKILKMNSDERLKNRVGVVKLPYTLLYPTSEEGLTGKGIPNSISM